MAINMSDEHIVIAKILNTQIDLEDIKQNMDIMFLVFNGIIVTCKYLYVHYAPTKIV